MYESVSSFVNRKTDIKYVISYRGQNLFQGFKLKGAGELIPDIMGV